MNNVFSVISIALIICSLVILNILTGFIFAKNEIKKECQKYGVFYIDEQQYNCEARK